MWYLRYPLFLSQVLKMQSNAHLGLLDSASMTARNHLGMQGTWSAAEGMML